MKNETIYQWHGIDAIGNKIQGEIKVRNLNACKAELCAQKIMPLQIRKKKSHLSFSRKSKIKASHISDFSKQLATLIKANIPLVSALEIISNDSDNSALSDLVQNIKKDVESGTAISVAFRKYPRYFNSLFCNLLNVGEVAGVLDKILMQIAEYNEKALLQKRKIFKALFYPSIVFIVALLVTAILLIFVIPQFKIMFTSFGAALPLYTQCVINVAEFMRARGLLIIAILSLLSYGLIWYAKHSRVFMQKLDRLILRVPLISKMLQKNLILRYAKTLAITLKSGLPLLDALTTVAGIMNNWVYKQAVLKIKAQVAMGQSLNVSMSIQNLFPKRVLQLVAIGEESGNLDDMFDEIAKFYEAELNYIIDTLNDLLEPFIMVVLGLLIGSLIIGMYLPIFRLGNVI